MGRRRRRLVDPTEDWEQLDLLCVWDGQRECERIRPQVLFGEPVPERSTQTGTSERVLYRKIAAFRDEGMQSLFSSPKSKRRVLPLAIRRKIVDLKAEHPPLNLEEIANICGTLFSRRPDGHAVKAVLEESAIPRKLVRRFPPYHEAEDVRESREAVVTLHLEGWADKSIARYLKVDRSTVYRVRRRFEDRGEEGLASGQVGRPKGVRKVDLRAMVEVRRMQENPELGAFRVHAALELMGIRLSPRTVGRILRANREAEGLRKPSRGRKGKREMPFEASHRHEYWTSDVRYVNHSIPDTGQAYVVAILENYSRAVLASAVTLSQDTNAYLSVLHAAIGRYGSPGTIVTDGGGIFRSDRAKAVYAALGIEKLEIERGQPWQSFIETNFGLQRRLADHFFAKAETWGELVEEHDHWLERHNTQRHFAHEEREDGRRSPSEVLGTVRLVRHHPVDLSRAFFSTMLVRKLDASGYARVKHWRVYAEEGLARCEVAVWLGDGQMAVEYGGQTLSRYDVSLSREARLEAVTNPRLFVTPYATTQPKLFALDALGEGGWLKALRLDEYAVRRRRPEALQQPLFPYLEAL
ncbi:MAG: helix-turn-helix domain-containing protein [Actinomycetota bacterium]|nr:helix-turn-helix domain-containing protein [Actinomycetota bacterium]